MASVYNLFTLEKDVVLDKRAARQLAYRIAATLLDNPQRVEEVVKREGLVANDEEAEALTEALEAVRQEMLELAEHDVITDDVSSEEMALYETIRAEQETNLTLFENSSREWDG